MSDEVIVALITGACAVIGQIIISRGQDKKRRADDEARDKAKAEKAAEKEQKKAEEQAEKEAKAAAKQAAFEQRVEDKFDRLTEKIDENKKRLDEHNGYGAKWAESQSYLKQTSKEIQELKEVIKEDNAEMKTEIKEVRKTITRYHGGA